MDKDIGKIAYNEHKVLCSKTDGINLPHWDTLEEWEQEQWNELARFEYSLHKDQLKLIDDGEV